MSTLLTRRLSFARLGNEDYVHWYFTITFSGFLYMNNAQHRMLYYLAIPFLAVYLARNFPWPLLRQPLILLSFAFLAWGLVSLLWSQGATAESTFRTLKTGPLIAFFLLAFGLYLARQPEAWDRLLRVYVTTAVPVALLLLLLNAPEIAELDSSFRLGGLGQGRNANDCGRLFAVALLLLLLAPQSALAVPAAAGAWAPALRWTAGLLFGAILLLTGSRGALLGFLASLSCLLALQRRWRELALLIALAGLPLALVLLETPLPRVLLSEEGSNGRLEIWQQALALWREEPLLGWGSAEVFRFAVERLGTFTAAHSVYLGTLLTLGLLGLLLFLVLLALALARAFAELRESGEARLLGLLLFGLVAMAFEAQSYYIQLNPEWLWFWIPLAGLAGLKSNALSPGRGAGR